MGIKTVIKAITITIFLIILLNTTAHPSSLSTHFMDIGDGDSTMVMLPSGKNILIDTGSPLSGIRVAQYLKSLEIKRIDHLILTHPHYDHIGGIFGVASAFRVVRFYDNGFSNFKDDIYKDYVSVIRQDISRYRILQAGESFNIDNLIIDILNPLLPPTGNLNADSIVMKLTYGRVKILLAGDMTRVTERRLLKLGLDLKSHVLKIAHHGEGDATSTEFLKAVDPEVAIISVSLQDMYARPHPDLLKRLQKAGIKVYRTDRDGTVILETDGNTYSVKRGKN
jgi:competence protein ComEC